MTTTTVDDPDQGRGLRVLELRAENFKRLTAVDITPDPDSPVVVVSGSNGAGKSSVLDALWAAIANSKAAKSTPEPIRHGADTARVEVDLGDLRVTRTWTGSGTRLTVTARDGNQYRKPQAVLDRLVGALSLDPVAFLGLRESEQVAQLLALLDLPQDPADLDRRRSEVYEARTEVGREVRRLAAQLEGMPEDLDAPVEEMSIGQALADLEAARTVVYAHEEQQRSASARAERVASIDEEITALTARIQDLTAERDRVDVARWEILNEAITAAGTLPDLDALTARIQDLEALNARARAASARRRTETDHAAVAARWETMTSEIGCLDETKASLLAEANMPLPGLGFDELGAGITYQGVPLRQCSSSEQIRVSAAIAMAGNPDLRVMRIQDGSLLDGESMRAVEDLARDAGWQVWIERVDDTGQVGVVIEDGAVAGGDR